MLARLINSRLPASLAGAALDLLLPPRCNNCDVELSGVQAGLLLCPDCRRLLGPEVWHCCRGCGARQPEELSGAKQCAWCRGGRFGFDKVVPLGAYWGGLRKSILRMKQSAGDRLSMTMGRLYTSLRGGLIEALNPDLVVPIPMHWRRRIVRGTNSATILAEQVASYLRVPLVEPALVRRRKTLPQADLPPSKRFRNVRGVFRSPAGYSLLRDARVLLMDDVLTTGATCSEAAKSLKTAGAKAVFVAVLGRAEGTHP